MKRIISLFLCLSLILTLAVPAFAAGNASFTATADKTTLHRGDEVTLDVAVSCSEPATGYSVSFSYDKSVFELVSGQVATIPNAQISNFNKEDCGFAYVLATSNAIAYTGSIGTLTFKVKDDAALGSYTITGDPYVKMSSTNIEATCTSTTFTVVCEHNFANGYCAECGAKNPHYGNETTDTEDIEFAAGQTKAEVTNCADALYHLSLFRGTGLGYELDSKLTREQAITMVVRLLGAEQEAFEKNYSHPFTDVPAWADPYVGYAHTYGITKGISTDLFGAGQPVTENQFLTFLLRLLKYQEGIEFSWDAPYDIAKQVGLQQEYATDETGFIRGGAVVLSWQFLSRKAKGSVNTVAAELASKGIFTAESFEEAKLISEGNEIP